MTTRRFLSRERFARMTVEKRDTLPDLSIDGTRVMWTGFMYIARCRADGTEAIVVGDECHRPEGMEDWNDQP